MAIRGSDEAVLKVRIDTADAERSLASFAETAASQFGRIQAAWQSFGNALQEGDRFADVMAHLRVNTDLAAQASQGLLSRLQLAQVANRAYAAGLELTAEQLRDLVVVSINHAEAVGIDEVQAAEKLTRAIATGSSRALREFGIDLEQNENRLVKAADGMRVVGERAERLGVNAKSAGDSISALSNAWDDLRMSVEAAAGDESRGLGGALSVVTDLVGAVSQSKMAVDALANSFLALAGPVTAAIATVSQFRNTLGSDPRLAGQLAAIGLQQARAGQARAQAMMMTARGLGLSDGSDVIRGDEVDIEGRVSQGGGGGRGGGTDWTARFRELQAEAAAERKATEQADIAAQREAAQARIDLYVEEQSRLKDLRLEAAEDQRAQMESQLGAQRDAAQRWIATEREVADMTIQAQREMVGVVANVAKQGAKLLGAGRGEMLVIDGIYETVQAAIAWANAATPGVGVAWIPAAVAHTAAAAMAFAEAGGLGGGGGRSRGGRGSASGGTTGGASFAPRPGLADTGGGGPVNVTVVMGPGGVVMGMDDDTLRRLGGVVREAQRRGHA